MREIKSDISGIVQFNFKTTFPHIFWVSNTISDTEYPNGVSYKILSVRNETENWSELALVRSFSDGKKEVLHRAKVSIAELTNAASIFTKGLIEKLGLDFEMQDFQTARTFETFRELAKKYGWSLGNPPSQ